MITLSQACQIVLSNNPSKRIWTANEMDDSYIFVVLDGDDSFGSGNMMGGIVTVVDVVMKVDGSFKKDVSVLDLQLNKIISHYEKDQIEKLLKEVS